MQSTVQNLVEANPVVLFTKSNCPNSKKVKKIFDDLGVNYQDTCLYIISLSIRICFFWVLNLHVRIVLDEEKEGDSLKDALGAMTAQFTVPYV